MDNTNYILEFAKIREVKSPEKAWNAAGWDFYVPTDLCITEFTKNWKIYVNDTLVNKSNIVSPAFQIQNKNDFKELWVRFYFDKTLSKIRYINCNSGKTIIEEWNRWIEDPNTVVRSIDLETNEKILIPSGIHVKLPENVFLKAENKSGIASKRGLIFGASTIDQDYFGEMHINLINVGNNIAIINAGDKIVQFIPMFQPIMRESKEYSSIEELYKNSTSERGAGGFGSSDSVENTNNEKTQEKTSSKKTRKAK